MPTDTQATTTSIPDFRTVAQTIEVRLFGMLINAVMLVSLPSSGSDWLSGLLQAVNPELRSDPESKEFFNPICNTKHYAQLRRVFGCELVDCHRNLAIPWTLRRESLEAVFARTWQSRSLTFTKEVFAFRKVGFFASRFNVIGLIRAARHTFPPPRLRVLTWYNAILQSFVDFERETGDPPLHAAVSFAVARAETLLERAVAGHTLALATLLESADMWKIPMLDWSLLVTLPHEVLNGYLVERLPAALRPRDVADAVSRTRQAALVRREEAYDATGVEPFRLALVDRLPKNLRKHLAGEREFDRALPLLQFCATVTPAEVSQ